MPNYLETVIKHSEEGNDILMSWPAKDVLICHQDTSDAVIKHFTKKGWHVFKIYDLDYTALKVALT